MKTWPELTTYSHYEQLRSLIARGFAAILREACPGETYEAASNCGKPLVFERLFEPGDEIRAQLLALLLALIEGEKLGPKVELTPERLAVIRSVLQKVLTAEDWESIAQAAAKQVQRQVMELRVA